MQRRRHTDTYNADTFGVVLTLHLLVLIAALLVGASIALQP